MSGHAHDPHLEQRVIDLARDASRQRTQGVAPGYWICPGCSVVYSIIAQSTKVPIFGHVCKKCLTPEMEAQAKAEAQELA